MEQSTAPVTLAVVGTAIVPATTPTVVGSPVVGNLIAGNSALNVAAAAQSAYLTSKIFRSFFKIRLFRCPINAST